MQIQASLQVALGCIFIQIAPKPPFPREQWRRNYFASNRERFSSHDEGAAITPPLVRSIKYAAPSGHYIFGIFVPF